MEGRDYINLGNGRPANTIPDEVKKFYTAKVNGVAYAERVYLSSSFTGWQCAHAAAFGITDTFTDQEIEVINVYDPCEHRMEHDMKYLRMLGMGLITALLGTALLAAQERKPQCEKSGSQGPAEETGLHDSAGHDQRGVRER